MNALPEIEKPADLTPFWRRTPLTKQEEVLWIETLNAHSASALRQNASSTALQIAAMASNSYQQSIAAALMTLGGAHAPIERTMIMLSQPDPAVFAANRLAQGLMIPGYGNSFIKGAKDDLWLKVDGFMEEAFPERHEVLEKITILLHAHGKVIYPNPSAYTAMTAIILGMSPQIGAYLFVAGRLQAWTAQFSYMSHPQSIASKRH